MQEFLKAKSVIEKIMLKYGISPQLYKLYDIWEEIVGKKLAKKVQVCGVKNSNILVTVDTPAYHHYIKLHQKEILEKINQRLVEEGQEFSEFKNIKAVKL